MDTDRIEKRVFLRASRSRVWHALADSTEFGGWFGMRFDAPFAPGATMRGTIVPSNADAEMADAQREHEGLPYEIQIEKMEPERLFSFRWHPHAIDPNVDYSAEPTTLVEFTLEEAEGGVMLTIVESGFDRIPLARRAEAFAANNGGWDLVARVIEHYFGQAA